MPVDVDVQPTDHQLTKQALPHINDRVSDTERKFQRSALHVRHHQYRRTDDTRITTSEKHAVQNRSVVIVFEVVRRLVEPVAHHVMRQAVGKHRPQRRIELACEPGDTPQHDRLFLLLRGDLLEVFRHRGSAELAAKDAGCR